jgi:LemA protein
LALQIGKTAGLPTDGRIFERQMRGHGSARILRVGRKIKGVGRPRLRCDLRPIFAELGPFRAPGNHRTLQRLVRGREKNMNPWIAVSVALVVGLLLFSVSTYNRLVSLKNHCENSFSQIQVQLKRRSDLIPSLVECVKGYMTHEREILELVTQARIEALGLRRTAEQPDDSSAVKNWLSAEGSLGRALGGLWAAMEHYPELKANRSVADLTEELTTTENRIAFARQSHNDWVTEFNSYRQKFPQYSVAGLFGFSQKRNLLEFADAGKLTTGPSVVLS